MQSMRSKTYDKDSGFSWLIFSLEFTEVYRKALKIRMAHEDS